MAKSEENRRPEPIEMVDPVYPYELLRAGVSGTVMVEFIIGADGHVLDARAMQSTNKGFEPAAVRAVLKWRFTPGMKGGRAVNVHASQILKFQLPEHILVYPFDLLKEGKEGKATVGFWVDENGRLKRTVVLEATNPAFGKAAQAMLADEFVTSAHTADSPADGMLRTTYSFDRRVRELASTREILKMLKKETKFVTPAELDQPLVSRFRQPPVFPLAMRDAQVNGSTLIEFFIDRNGEAQLPRVVSSTHEDFGYAAAQAVGQWRFNPPMQKGKTVIVRLQIPVEFKFEEAKK